MSRLNGIIITAKKHSRFLLVALLFACLYSLISLVNHYLFRTYALDLGLYTNAMYDYVHLRWNDSGVFKEVSENLLADHFDLYLVLFSPLTLITGTYTLLIVQILAVMAGGTGVYRYFMLKQDNKLLALLAAIYFFLFFGIFSAVSNDYHSNVVAVMILPWFFCAIRERKILTSFLLLLLLLISKENIPLWMVFICAGLIPEYRKDRRMLKYLSAFAIISLVYFIFVTGLIMPALSAQGSYPHFKYAALGSTPLQAFIFLITHPVEWFRCLFFNHVSAPFGDYVKLELHVLLLICGLYLLFLKPGYFLMLVPVYFQKLFHDDFHMWGIDAQYAIEFAPVLAIGIFTFITELKNRKIALILAFLVIAGSLFSTVRIMDHTVSFTNKSKIRFYKKDHYRRNYDVAQVHKALAGIPADAVVSAQSPFVAQLALRDHIYQFPIVKDAQYIVFSEMESPYPMTETDFARLTALYANSPEWKPVIRLASITVLQRTF